MDLAGGAVFEGDAAAEGRGRLGALKKGKGGFLNGQWSRVRGFAPFSDIGSRSNGPERRGLDRWARRG